MKPVMSGSSDLQFPAPAEAGRARAAEAPVAPRARGTVQGHALTIFPGLLKYLRRWRTAGEREVYSMVTDRDLGTVMLSGLYGEVPGADTLAIIVHGHGGNAGKPYCYSAALAARQCGISSLRISLRGADLLGEDIYHGGLTEDLASFVSGKDYAHYRKLVLFGFSIGGHLVLRAALEGLDPRLRAVVAVSPPIDIAGAVASLDGPGHALYRRYIIHGLHRIYAAVDLRQRAGLPLGVVRRAKTFREFDELTVVPRFGFRNVDHYYSRITLKNRLGGVRVPALVVASNHDPVVPASVMRNALLGASRLVVTRWVDGGGHLHFPRGTNLDLGPAPLGLASQCVHWALRSSR